MTSRLSLALKVPVVVAIFLIGVAILTSERVLARLTGIQQTQIETLAKVYFDGLSVALVDAVLREDVWEVFAVLDRNRHDSTGITAVETIVTTADNRIIASTNPRRFATSAALPIDYPTIAADGVVLREAASKAYARRVIAANGRPVGAIHSELDVSTLIQERRSVLRTLVLSNAALTVFFVGVAWLTVRRMMRPLRVLSRHLEEGITGEVAPIPADQIEAAGPEYRRLFTAFNTIAHGFHEREGLMRRLAEEEKLASLGRLASGMAHEINNPLGGLFNALDTLKHHADRPEVRHRSIQFIERGLRGIRDVVRSTLMTYRSDRDNRELDRSDLDDLRFLAGPEARRNALTLTWTNELPGAVGLPASAVRQIVLNLLLNACQATPRGGGVDVSIAVTAGEVRIDVTDSGPGLPAFASAILAERALPSAPIGPGLGLWMTRRLVVGLKGRISSAVSPLGGAHVTVAIPIPALPEAVADVA